MQLRVQPGLRCGLAWQPGQRKDTQRDEYMWGSGLHACTRLVHWWSSPAVMGCHDAKEGQLSECCEVAALQRGAPVGLLTSRACARAGGRILLKNTTLHLFRGQRYGLCGANGAGKSTLMRSIAAGQLDVRACPCASGARMLQ